MSDSGNNIYKYMTSDRKLNGENSKTETRSLINYFEKSTGVFNGDGVITQEQLADIKKRAHALKNIWHGFISLNKEMSYKIDSPEKCMRLIKRTFGEFFKDMGLDPNNVDLICALHKDKPHHLHIHFWFAEREPKCKYRKRQTEYRHKGKIEKSVLDRMHVRLNMDISESHPRLYISRDEALRELKKISALKDISRNKQERGRSCDYSANLKKTDIEPLVIEFIKELVQDEHFAAEIKKKIGLQVDTSKIDTEIHNYETKLKEVEINKARLEREIDSLPIDVAHRERKIHDMTLRLDGLYDTIAEIEANIEDARTRRKSVEAEFITMENIYKILEHFNELYDIISDEEKKELIATLVKEIQIYPEGESEMPLKSMKFNFPVYKDGKEVREIFLNNNTNVETLVVLSHKKPDSHLEVKIDSDNTLPDKTAIAERAEKRKPQEKTTYKNM